LGLARQFLAQAIQVQDPLVPVRLEDADGRLVGQRPEAAFRLSQPARLRRALQCDGGLVREGREHRPVGLPVCQPHRGVHREHALQTAFADDRHADESFDRPQSKEMAQLGIDVLPERDGDGGGLGRVDAHRAGHAGQPVDALEEQQAGAGAGDGSGPPHHEEEDLLVVPRAGDGAVDGEHLAMSLVVVQ
jgi:hypothetical protein